MSVGHRVISAAQGYLRCLGCGAGVQKDEDHDETIALTHVSPVPNRA